MNGVEHTFLGGLSAPDGSITGVELVESGPGKLDRLLTLDLHLVTGNADLVFTGCQLDDLDRLGDWIRDVVTEIRRREADAQR